MGSASTCECPCGCGELICAGSGQVADELQRLPQLDGSVVTSGVCARCRGRFVVMNGAPLLATHLPAGARR